MKKSYYNNNLWGQYYAVPGLGRVGYARLGRITTLEWYTSLKVIFYIK